MEEQESGWRNKGLLLAAGAGVVAAIAGAAWLLTRKRTGKGTKEFPSGEMYTGDLVEGRAEGFGVSRTREGDVMTGQFKNDLPHGRCSIVLASGHTFEGDIWEGKRMEGVFHYGEDGDMDFSGVQDEVTGAKTGNVVGRTVDGVEFYRGTLVNDLEEGDDCWLIAIDGTYEGAMRKGQREGRGKLTGVTGTVYEGEWKGDTKHGEGTMRYANSEEYAGTWREGQWQDGLLRRPDGRVDRVLAGKIVK